MSQKTHSPKYQTVALNDLSVINFLLIQLLIPTLICLFFSVFAHVHGNVTFHSIKYFLSTVLRSAVSLCNSKMFKCKIFFIFILSLVCSSLQKWNIEILWPVTHLHLLLTTAAIFTSQSFFPFACDIRLCTEIIMKDRQSYETISPQSNKHPWPYSRLREGAFSSESGTITSPEGKAHRSG